MSVPIRILLVEDNPDDETLAIRAFRKCESQTEISVARDGQEALDILLDDERPLPSVLMLDLKLPKISGLKVLEEIRNHERTQRIPVIVLVSPDEPAAMKSSYESRANGTMSKPIQGDEFTQVLLSLGIGPEVPCDGSQSSSSEK